MPTLNKENLHQDFERFIAFGTVLDKTTRKYIIAYFKALLEGEKAPMPEDLNQDYYRYLHVELDKIFGEGKLLEIFQQKGILGRQILSDSLQWFRKTQEKIEQNNPYSRELLQFEHWRDLSLVEVKNRQQHLWAFLQATYPEFESTFGFHQEKLKNLTSPDEKSEMIYQDMLQQWDAKLNAKVLSYQLDAFKKAMEDFSQKLSDKVDNYQSIQDIMGNFQEYVEGFWNLSKDAWDNESLDLLKAYDELLEDEESVKKLADLLGSLRDAETEVADETYEEIIQPYRFIKDKEAKEEISGIEKSDDFNRVLPSEMRLFTDPLTEDLFLKKWSDKSLLSFAYEGKKKINAPELESKTRKKVQQKQKGPFIICVDTSESMDGMPEKIAKILCFAILKMAVHESRKAFLINFSTGIETMELSDLTASMPQLTRFLKRSFHGGTDITLPLIEALKKLKKNEYEFADVLVISDFIMYKMDEDLLEEIKDQQQNKQTQFHSLTLYENPNYHIISQFDTNWFYDINQKGVMKSLYTSVKGVMERDF